MASAGHSTAVLDGVLQLPTRRVPAGRGRRCAAGPDEDAITLAAEAVLALCARLPAQPAALVLAAGGAPYDEGGNVQAVAELTGLAGDRLAVELTQAPTDGLAALRLAHALCAAGAAPVMVVGAHRRRDGAGADEGDGAAALLVGSGPAAAALRAGPAAVEEVRDRWRLAGRREPMDGDPSFSVEFGAAAPARRVAAGADGEVAVCLRDARAADRAERELGGPGDPLVGRTGLLGAAHPLARALAGLDRPLRVVAAAGGAAYAVDLEPGPLGAELAARARAAAAGGRDAEVPSLAPMADGLSPYQSAPRAWRERGQDLRLEGRRCTACERVLYPPPAACPACGAAELTAVRLGRTGRVMAMTRDHAYPAAEVTGMAVVEVDGGGRFYGQVAASEEVATGERVRLVPRRLHEGGGWVQYHWKVAQESGR